MVNNKKEMTLDELASMVAKGFEGVDKKFEGVDKKIGDIEERMITKDEFNFRFNALEKKFDKLDYQVDEVYDILKRFEEGDILNLQKRVQNLERAVKVLTKSNNN